MSWITASIEIRVPLSTIIAIWCLTPIPKTLLILRTTFTSNRWQNDALLMIFEHSYSAATPTFWLADHLSTSLVGLRPARLAFAIDTAGRLAARP